MYRAFSRGFLLRIIHTHKYMHYTCNVIQLNTPHHNKYYPMPILYMVGFRVFFISLMETGIYVRDRSRILRWRGSHARSAGKILVTTPIYLSFPRTRVACAYILHIIYRAVLMRGIRQSL